MKKLSAILSLLLFVGLFHQGVVLAEMTKEKKPTKTNFTAKKKHGTAMAATTTTTKAATVAPVVVPPAPAASSSPTS